MIGDVEQYQCSLCDASVKYAANKLGEHANDREGAVGTLRSWLLQQQKWLDTPTESKFLLSFLRMRKFSQVFARQSVVNYWDSRDKYPKWFHNVDTHDPSIKAVLSNGSYISLGHDKKGRRVLLGRPSIMDTSGKNYNCDDVIKVGFALSDYWLQDEMTQVHGFVVFMDFTGLSLKHQSFVGLRNLMNNTTIMTKIYPIRTQEVHQYNMGIVGETVYSVARPFLPFKVKERMFMHSNLSTVYEHINRSLLPDEYLEDDYNGPSAGPIHKLVESLVEEMSAPNVRDYLLDLSRKPHRINTQVRPKYDECASQSFRQLSV